MVPFVFFFFPTDEQTAIQFYTSHDMYVQEAGLWGVPDSQDGDYVFRKLVVPVSALKSMA